MYDNLIEEYLEGRLPVEDEARLFAWVNQSEDNAVHFRMVQSEWSATHSPSAEAISMLEVVRKRVERNSELRSRNRRGRIWGIGSVAMVVAAMIIAAFLWLRPDAASITEPSSELYTMSAPMGTHSMLSLPDGSNVWLNAGSSLTYDSDFNRRSREISLVGEAYFEVAHNDVLPFVVRSRGCEFTVLGTKFDISAYDDDPSLQVVLMEGSLQVRSELSTDLMSPGDRIRLNGAEEEMTKDRVNAVQYCSWKDGHIVYDKITLPDLVRKLSREYNVEIILNTDAYNTRNLRVSFTDVESVESVLGALCDIMPLSVSRSNGTYFVNNK